MTTDAAPLVLITGATRGIGAATARLLAPRCRLVLAGRDRDSLAELAAELSAGYPDAVAAVVAVDLTDHDATRRALTEQAPEALDRLDGLVHCAGAAGLGPVADAADPEVLAGWERMYAVNVVAVAFMTALLLPALRAAGGHVVAVNSGAGHNAKPGWGAYAASKHGLRALTDSLRAEEPGIRVTSIHPGRVDTDMQRDIVAAEGGEYEPEKYLSPESVARAVDQALAASGDAHPTEVVLRPAGG